MCGIVGLYNFAAGKDALSRMLHAIAHRGPDAEGIAESHIHGADVRLGHRRLAIIDLSDAANQPFEKDGLVVVYNGEIYNYQDLKKELAASGIRFRTTSDTVARTTAVTSLAGRLPTPRNRRFVRDLRTLDDAVYGLIERRRRDEAGDGRDDLLAVLMAARHPETGRGMSERELRDEVATMLVSGSVTTANALTWTWYLLARHLEAQEEVHREAVRALAGDAPGAGDLDGLGYTKAVIQEALRLYPPTWRLARTTVVADRSGGHEIPAGTTVVFSRTCCTATRRSGTSPRRSCRSGSPRSGRARIRGSPICPLAAARGRASAATSHWSRRS